MAKLEILEDVPPVVLSRRAAAQFIGLGQRTFDALAAEKVIPSVKIGKRRLFRREALIKFLERKEKESR
jgi:excisionase family DNA binding protein